MPEYRWVAAGDERTVAEVVNLVAEVSAMEPFVGLPIRPTEPECVLLKEKLLCGLASGGTHLLAVLADRQVIGCVVVTRPATANQRHIGELTTGLIRSDHRGKGVVTEAFRAIVAHCERIGIELLRMDVREGIPAEKVWRGYGFAEYGRLTDYGRVGGESYTGVYLVQPVAELKSKTNETEDGDA